MRQLRHQAVTALARATAQWPTRRGVEVDSSVLFFGRPILRAVAGSRIELGAGARLVSRSAHTPLGVNHPVVIRTLHPGAEVVVGEGTGISGGVICAATSVRIGRGCLLGANVTVVDTDFHPIDSPVRAVAPLPTPRPEDRVIIGDNVFLGTGSIVLKGVTIGDNAVIGAGSVVTRDCPPGVIMAGNPARPVGSVALRGTGSGQDALAGPPDAVTGG